MIIKRLRRYAGLVSLVTLLTLFTLFVIGANNFVDENILSRDSFLAARTASYAQILQRDAEIDSALQKAIMAHAKLLRDGGLLEGPDGLQWELGPEKNSAMRTALDRLSLADRSNDLVTFESAYLDFARRSEELDFSILKQLTIAQLVSQIIIFLGFLGILGYLLLRLGRSDDVAESIEAENEHILASVNEGLFLIDGNYLIGRQRSHRVKEIFGSGVEVEGNFFELLKKIAPNSDVKLAREYVELLMAGRVKQKLMRDINPLQEVPVDVIQNGGGKTRKFLQIDFTRDESGIVSGQRAKNKKALVSITDVTREVMLRDELEHTREQQKERLGLLLSVVQVNPEQLNDYFKSSSEALIKVNSILAQEGAEHGDNVKKLDQISNTVHKLKGDASALNLDFFSTAFHDFEDSIAAVRQKLFIDGRDMLALTVHLKEIIAELDVVKTIAPQLRSVGVSQNKPVDPKIAEMPERLLKVAKKAAENEGKHVDLSCTGTEILADYPQIADKINSMAVQLVKNSVVHGIEMPAVRLEQDKSPLGMIRIKVSKDDGKLKLSVLDDGRGLDFDRIRKKVAKTVGLDKEQARQLDRGKLLHYIFMPGFSALDDASVDAGRGVGLSMVRDESNNIGGKIAVKSTPNKHCQFSISIPLDSLEAN